MAHSSRARPALARLPEIDPAIAALALWCAFRDGAGPTVTEGETIRIGPEFAGLPLSEQTGVIAHHVLHVALRHSARRAMAAQRHGDGFQPALYDLACDGMVNEVLLQGGHALPRPAVRAAEMIALLPQEARPGNVLAEWDSDRLYAALAEQDAAQQGGADGEISRYARARGFAPDLKAGDPDTTGAEIWSGRVTQALGSGQRAGSGIGTVLGRFGDLPQARVPWELRLRRLLNKALLQQPRPSHRNPARAWLARDALARQRGGPAPVFEPGTTRQTLRPRLVIGLDTSSSIRAAMLDLFVAEALSITRRTGAETHLLGFDTEVHGQTLLTSAQSLHALEMRRDGGTDFAPVLAAARALAPSMTIVLTDLDAPLPAPAFGPLLWAVPEPPRTAPDYGDVLVMQDAA